MTCRIKTAMAAALALAAAGLVFAQAPRWQNLYPAYTGLAFDGAKFVAVSGDGLIRTTTDGEAWFNSVIQGGDEKSRRIYAVASGGGQYMAVQNNSQCLLSEDGSGWREVDAGLGFHVRHMAFGNGKFIGVGDEDADGGTFVYDQNDPDDGWVDEYAPPPLILSHVAFGADGFAAVGTGIARLNNNNNWAAAAGVPTSAQVSVVAFGGDKFVALSKNGANVYTSSDRTAWATEPASGAAADMADMVFGGGKFVAVGKGGKGCWSSNGTSWTTFTLNSDDDFTAVKYGNNIFLALGAKGSVYTSGDGSNWTRKAGNSVASYKQIAYGGNKYVAVGDSGVSVSSDGINWERKSNAANLTGVAFGASKFVAVSDNGTIIYSGDGNTWTDKNLGDAVFTSIAFGGATFIAGGRTPGAAAQSKVVVYTSTNGEDWNSYEATDLAGWAAQGEYIVSLCFGGDKFIAAAGGTGAAKTLKECPAAGNYPGKYWSNVPGLPDAADGYPLVSAVYANDKFVVLGAKSTGESVVISADAAAASWTAITIPNIKGMRAAAYAKGSYFAVGDSGGVYAQLNGQWIQQGKGVTNRNLYTIYTKDDAVIVAGAGGVMLRSTDVPTSVRYASAPRAAASSKGGAMSLSRFGRSPAVTLSFTPNSAGMIAVYSLSGRQLYRARLGAGERSAQLPERVMSSGSVIVRYSGGGRTVSQRFQVVR